MTGKWGKGRIIKNQKRWDDDGKQNKNTIVKDEFWVVVNIVKGRRMEKKKRKTDEEKKDKNNNNSNRGVQEGVLAYV